MKIKVQPLALSVAIILLIVCAQYNYLLFHSISEVFSITVGCGIFMFAWNTKDYTSNDYFQFLGIAYLFIVLLDFVHTLSYGGMEVFPDQNGNLTAQLWIAARYLESISLLISPWYLTRKLNYKLAFIAFSVISVITISAIFAGFFPDCFIEGSGLTLFKKMSEYAISTFLAAACLNISKNKQKLDRYTYRLIVTSILLTIGSELSFTFYISLYGTSNLVGHIFKIASFYLIYEAIIANGLRHPYQILAQREEELQLALNEVKTLRGIIPICMHCKKIRDTRGEWEKIEKYVSEHSHAEFSHSICEECLQKFHFKQA